MTALSREGLTVVGKLVRDRIPEIIRASGRIPRVKVLDAAEYEDALHEKLLEEAAELRAAHSLDERIGEAADVLEVLKAMAVLYGFTMTEVVKAAESKALERGGFDDRLWLD